MLHSDFIKPLYDGHCFSDIPPTLHYLLTGTGHPGLASDVLGPYQRQFQSVILFFLDSFGWFFLTNIGNGIRFYSA